MAISEWIVIEKIIVVPQTKGKFIYIIIVTIINLVREVNFKTKVLKHLRHLKPSPLKICL